MACGEVERLLERVVVLGVFCRAGWRHTRGASTARGASLQTFRCLHPAPPLDFRMQHELRAMTLRPPTLPPFARP